MRKKTLGLWVTATGVALSTHASAQIPTAPPPEPPPLATTPPPTSPPPTSPPPTSSPPAATPERIVVQPPARPRKYEEQWYGWQTLLFDVGAIGTTFVGLSTSSSELFWAGHLGFMLGAPVVHFGHGNVGKGFGSFALRLFVPPVTAGVGAITGLIVNSDSNDRSGGVFSGLTGLIYGFVIGYYGGLVLSSGIDAFALARERVEVEGTALRRAPTRPWFTVAPTVDFTKSHGTVGVAGTF